MLVGLGVALSACSTDDESSADAGTTVTTTAATAAVSTASTASTVEPADGGGGEDESGAATTTAAAESESTAAAPPSGEPLRLMVISERSGPFEVSFMGDGAAAAAEAINRAGGVNGRPVEVELCDTGDDPNAAAACARSAVDGDVLALVSTWTNHEQLVLPITDEAGLANIGSAPGTVAGFLSPNSFPITGGGPFFAIGEARALQAAGAEKISMLLPDLAATSSEIIEVIRAIIGEDVLERVVKVPIPAPDLAAYVATAAEGVDAVIAGLPPDDNVRLIPAIRQHDSGLLVGALTTDPDQLIEAVGDDGEGVVVSLFQRPLGVDDPAVLRYVADMEAAGFEPDNSSMLGYAGVLLFAHAVEGLSEIDRASVLAAMNGVSDFDSGLFAPIDYTTPQTLIPGLRLFNTRMISATITDGELDTDGEFFDAAAP